MSRIRYILPVVAVFVLAVACSKSELSPADTGTATVNITASADWAIARVTSTTDDAPTRFYGQAVNVATGEVLDIVEGNPHMVTWQFSFVVNPDAEYTFMFWADSAHDSEPVPTDLRNVSYQMGRVAFAAAVTGTAETVDKVVELNHVVTKLTLVTTADVSYLFTDFLSISAQSAEAYNVQTGSVLNSSVGNAVFAVPSAGLSAGSEVFSTYIMPANTTGDIGIYANGKFMTVAGVDVSADRNVILRGDLSENNPNWNNI